jgi:hypothetical protein
MSDAIHLDLNREPVRRGFLDNNIRLLGALSGAVQANFGGEK